MIGYVGVGHGRKPDGSFDPGASDEDLVEHQLNWLVANVVTAGLRRSGVAVVSEVDLAYRTDPNYRGAREELKRRGCAWGVEIHHDWRSGYRGVAVLWQSNDDRTLGEPIVKLAHYLGAVGVPRKAPSACAMLVHRPSQHAFLKAGVPTIIAEAGRVDTDDRGRWDLLIARGEIIAAGLVEGLRALRFTDRTYVTG